MGNYNDLYTMTPGSAVADTLDEILTRKRLEARQAMMDRLNEANTQSEIRYRDENIRSMAEDRASRAENRKAQEETRRASLLTPDQPLVGSDLEYWQKNSPSMVNPAQEGTRPLGEDEMGPELPSKPASFHGTPEQILKRDNENRRLEAIRIMNTPEFAARSPLEKWAIIHQATGASAPDSAIKTQGQAYAVTPSGKFIPSGIDSPNGNEFIHLPAPAPNVYDPPIETKDKDGNVHLFTPNRRNGLASEMKFPEGITPVGKLGVAKPEGPYKPRLHDKAQSDYAKARGDATDGTFMTASAKKKAIFAQMEQNIYSKFDANVAAVAQANVDQPDSIDETVAAAVEHGDIKPEQAPQLAELLRVVK